MDSGYSLSDIAAVNGHNNDDYGWGGGMGFFWIFALLLLPMLSGGGLWGNRAGETPATESALCSAFNFNNLENAVGRLGDRQLEQFTSLTNGICNLGYEQLRNTNALAMQSAQETNATQAQLAECCCSTKQLIQETNYNNALNTAAINANTTAGIQKVLDQLCADRAAQQAARIQQLELNQALAGVVRYPLAMTYTAGFSPFCNSGCCGQFSNI